MGISESNTLVASFGWVAIGILIVLAGITIGVLRRRAHRDGASGAAVETGGASGRAARATAVAGAEAGRRARSRVPGPTFEELTESRALRDAIAGLGCRGRHRADRADR